jgi:GNAT superfamily N-acetyltransferase
VDVVIRRATLDDRARLVELLTHFISSTPYGRILPVRPKYLDELAFRVLRMSSAVTFVAEVDGVLVGMISGFAMEDPAAGVPILDELVWWVEPAHRGTSTIGPRLLKAFETWGRQKGLAWCKMVAPNAEVGAFYARLGYALLETSFVKRL